MPPPKRPLAAAAALALAAAASAAAPPNFLVVLVDDWAWGDLGANGYGAETPAMDRYAVKGVRFTDMHANSVCTPTRSALQTGRYNARYGLSSNFDVDSKGGLALGEITVAQLLKAGANFSTKIAGKWHLGHSGADGRPDGGYHPTWRGYDEYFGAYANKSHPPARPPATNP